MPINTFIVDETFDQKRVDQVVATHYPDISRTKVLKIIKSDMLKINGKVMSNDSTKVKVGDEIQFETLKAEELNLVPKKIDLNIIFEDDDIIIIDKPIGMVVHPGAGNYEDTMVNGLLYHCKNKLSGMSGEDRPGIIHRIDKDTSGLLVIAKNNFAHSNLGEQFSNHSIERKYLCLAWGVIRPLNGKISTLISRDKKNRQLMTVSEINGKKAITNYKTIQVFNIKDIPKISLLECELETGRTHQIRVHLKYKGTSLLGDKQYGKKNIKFKKINNDFFNKLNSLSGQALHAKTLGFIHPKKKKWMNFNSELPDGFKKILNLLENLSS